MEMALSCDIMWRRCKLALPETGLAIIPGGNTCSLAATEDSFPASLAITEGEAIYDYCWYPYMFASSAFLISVTSLSNVLIILSYKSEGTNIGRDNRKIARGQCTTEITFRKRDESLRQSGITKTSYGDAKHASDLVKLLEGANQRVPAEIRDMASRGRGGRSASSFGGRSSFGGGRDGNRFSSGGYQQQMSFHDNVGVLKRSVAGADVLLAKLAQDGESAAPIGQEFDILLMTAKDEYRRRMLREQFAKEKWQQRNIDITQC
ncbi:hypothetical protein Tco_1146112 [Tanacetum coccineum]